jgi:hypothetical protein
MPTPKLDPLSNRPVKLEGWRRGMNTLLRDDSLPLDALRRCVNYDIDDEGRIERRVGRDRVYTGSIQAGTLWSGKDRTLFVEGGDLKELLRMSNGSYAALTLHASVGVYPMSYLELNGQVYYSNPLVSGVITKIGVSRPWGLPAPVTQPNLTAGGPGGQLAIGRYQVAVTFLTSDGEESGTGVAAEVEVTTDGGTISLSSFPPPPSGAAYVRVYCSHVHGEGLYRVADLPANTSIYQIVAVSNVATALLRTQFCERPPAGQLLEYHNGRVYIASGNVVWMTEPLRYGCVHQGRGFLLFPKPVTVLKAVSDGLFVCSDLTYFIQGFDTPQLKQREVLPYGGVYNTGVDLPNYDAVAWFSHQGITLGARSGEILNVMQDRVAVAQYGSGVMQVREMNGTRQIIANLKDAELPTFAAPDYVSLEAARAGAAYT